MLITGINQLWVSIIFLVSCIHFIFFVQQQRQTSSVSAVFVALAAGGRESFDKCLQYMFEANLDI